MVNKRSVPLRPTWYELAAGVAVASVKAGTIAAGVATGLLSLPHVVWWGLGDALATGLAVSCVLFVVRLHAYRVQGRISRLSAAASSGFDVSRSALEDTRSRVTDEVRSAREKQSKHEFRHALQLQEMRRELAEIRSDTEFLATRGKRDGGGVARRVLMVTSNGAGLGHLTRCLALAQLLPADWRVDILTLSTGWRRVDSGRSTMHYFPSHDALGISQHEWNRRFGRAYSRLLDDLRPDVVAFDGTYIYRPIAEGTRHHAIPLVWIVRGCWKPGRETVQTAAPELYADALLLPEDIALAADDFPVATDRIPVLRTPPLLLRIEPLRPDEARRALRLAETNKHVLVQLGAGNVDDIREKLHIAVSAVRSLGEDWVPVIVDSPISRQAASLPGDVIRIAAYPLAQYYRAFEFVVLAAGYNSVQEALALRVPAVLVPNHATLTDDQARRASEAARRGMALEATDNSQLADAIQRLGDRGQRTAIVEALATLNATPVPPPLTGWLNHVLVDHAQRTFTTSTVVLPSGSTESVTSRNEGGAE